ncbi:MAG: hypothetical protein AAF702_03945 [Chloroflexota bacterium]
MTDLIDKPVILASSFTGLLISLSLSKANIDHILIGGDEPDDRPRLGESISEQASFDFLRLLDAELRQYVHIKSHVSFLNGKTVSMVYPTNPHRTLDDLDLDRKSMNLWNMFDYVIHIERDKFDRVLYHKVKANPHCTFIHNTNAQIVHDPKSDRITAIQLDEDVCIEKPPYVFDATGPMGLVAQAAGVTKKAISDEERVVWTHHWRESSSPLPKVWWLCGTNILRLLEDVDGVDGAAWLIAMEDTISVGISIDASTYPTEQFSRQDLIQTLDAAFARRGFAYSNDFPNTKPIAELCHEHFIRERAFGSNWLLAGTGYLQLWFPTAAGVVSTMWAARLAPRFLHEPLRTGHYYQQTQKALLSTHNHIHHMVKGQPFTGASDAYRFLAKGGAHILAPSARTVRFVNGPSESFNLEDTIQEKLLSLVKKVEPSLLVPLMGGLFSVEEISTLAKQSQAFKRYFDYPLQNIENSISVLPKFLSSKFALR